MTSPMDCIVNGIALTDVDDSVQVTDIVESVPQLAIRTARCAGAFGQRVLRKNRTALQVTVRLVIRSREPLYRAMVADRLRRWARDGELRVSYREGQLLRVRCTQPPAAGSMAKWEGEIRIGFTAYECPYWQSREKQRACAGGTEGETSLAPVGSTENCFLEFSVTPREETMTSLSVTAGDTRMTFSGLDVPPGDAFTLRYDDSMLQRIGWTTQDGHFYSRLNRRDPSSDDDLLLCQQARNTVRFSADAACDTVFEARGLYE